MAVLPWTFLFQYCFRCRFLYAYNVATTFICLAIVTGISHGNSEIQRLEMICLHIHISLLNFVHIMA
jgi:hypothetical protein